MDLDLLVCWQRNVSTLISSVCLSWSLRLCISSSECDRYDTLDEELFLPSVNSTNDNTHWFHESYTLLLLNGLSNVCEKSERRMDDDCVKYCYSALISYSCLVSVDHLFTMGNSVYKCLWQIKNYDNSFWSTHQQIWTQTTQVKQV